MLRQKPELNIIYISERMRHSLQPVARSSLTAVVAPMGYGKTTAINWYLNERGREGAAVLRVSIYSANRAIFWKSLQKAFAQAGLTVLEGYECPTDASGAALLLDDLCTALAGERETYLFLDDFHLLRDEQAAAFLCALANRLPGNAHLVVASRNDFLPQGEILRLGQRLHRVGADQLRLNEKELSAYVRRCGMELTEPQRETLLHSCEGWFSAIYLNLHALAERGTLLPTSSDIYAMFTAAMIESLPPQRQEFLAVMGLADEFTVEMASAVTRMPDAEQVLLALTRQNAFVTRLPDGESFRFHHMMKECAERLFAQLLAPRQAAVWERYGRWYEARRQYLPALRAYEKCGDYDAALRVIEEDAGILLASLGPAELLERLGRCPVDALKRHPLAILVLMRRMFTCQQIPKMMELKALLEAAVREHPELPAQERGNLLGECDLILSFLMYNDITRMSRLHRSASRQVTRPAVTLRNSGSWTFGSPSVLMMYYRAPGELGKELAEMYECMPHYYKITQGHGQGAELVMDAEAAFMQGHFERAVLLLERARVRAASRGQENMALCCDFLALRLSLCGQAGEPFDFEARRAALLQRHDAVLLHLLESIEAYYYALLGRTDAVPEVFREHRLASVSYFALCRPMMEMIELQVWLAQGQAVKVLARCEELLAACQRFHYGLVALHVRVQMAAAYGLYGQPAEARAALEQALAEAAPDGFWMPLAENYRYLAPLLAQGGWGSAQPLVERAIALGQRHEARCAQLNGSADRPAIAAALTEKELALARLVAQRRTNKEIAETLHLSEGTVKQYINQLYAKLDIGGAVRNKRVQLAALFGTKY